MKTATTIAQILLSIGFIIPGFMKLLNYDMMVADPKMAWMQDFSHTQIIIISVLEILGVLGMTLPLIIKKFKKLVPISAFCLMLLGIGAVATHAMRDENFMPPLVLAAFALFVVFRRKDLLKGEA